MLSDPQDRAWLESLQENQCGSLQLAAELVRVRARGWADASGEREPDLAALAAPVWGTRGDLAAILGIQGPESRFDGPRRDAAIEPLLAAARTLSEWLGATPARPPRDRRMTARRAPQ